MKYPRVIAHRCGGALAPENTLTGLRVAARMGCRGVEFDVMLTADDIPILMHDETLERTTSGSGALAALSAAELSGVDAGCRHHRAFTVSPVPTLEAALALCAELDLWANVEIKPTAGRDEITGRVVAAQVARLIAVKKCEVMLSSFSEPALHAAAESAEQLSRALLLETLMPDWRQRMDSVGAQALHCEAQCLLGNPDVLARLASKNFPVACYTVNSRAIADRLFAAGVSAIFSDRIDLWNPAEM